MVITKKCVPMRLVNTLNSIAPSSTLLQEPRRNESPQTRYPHSKHISLLTFPSSTVTLVEFCVLGKFCELDGINGILAGIADGVLGKGSGVSLVRCSGLVFNSLTVSCNFFIMSGKP